MEPASERGNVRVKRGDGIWIPVEYGDSGWLHIGEKYLAKHINCCGNPGMGKSTVQMHILEEVERRDEVAVVVGDPKAEYYARFFRPERGDWNIDPASDDGCYWASEREAVDRAASENWGLSFIPDPPGEDHRFFPQNARAGLAGLMSAHNEAKNPRDPATCENLAQWLSADEAVLMQRLARIPGTKAFNPKAPQQLSGLTGTLAPLAPSFGMMPRKSEGRREFAVREWAEDRDGSWIFLTSTPGTREASRPVQTAIIDNLLRAIEKRVPGAKRIWVICDELSLMKRMGSLIESAALQRDSGNPLVLGFQNSSQIELLYGRAGMQALLGQAFTQICFASTDPTIQEHIEKQCGYAEVERISENMPSHFVLGKGHARSSSLTSHQVAHDPVIMATEIGHLPPYDFVIKQRDMVRRARICPNLRVARWEYRRRLIPEMKVPEPLVEEDEDDEVPVDEEDIVPVDGVAPEEEPADVRGSVEKVLAEMLAQMAKGLAGHAEVNPLAKKVGRPAKQSGGGLPLFKGAESEEECVAVD
jgi:hypothetical protein